MSRKSFSFQNNPSFQRRDLRHTSIQSNDFSNINDLRRPTFHSFRKAAANEGRAFFHHNEFEKKNIEVEMEWKEFCEIDEELFFDFPESREENQASDQENTENNPIFQRMNEGNDLIMDNLQKSIQDNNNIQSNHPSNFLPQTIPIKQKEQMDHSMKSKEITRTTFEDFLDDGRTCSMEIVSMVADFLESALYCILYSHQIYPQDLFERRLKYGEQVIYVPRYNQVSNYIVEFVQNVRTILLLPKKHPVNIEVYLTDYEKQEPLERFIFQVQVKQLEKQKYSECSDFVSLDASITKSIETSLSKFLLQLMIHEPTFQSRGCQYFLQTSTLSDWIFRENDKVWKENKYVSIDSHKKVFELEKIETSLFSLRLQLEVNTLYDNMR